MGDQNVFHLVHQENFKESKYQDKSILLLSSRLDAINSFDKIEVGYDSPTSSIVTLLATVELLYRYSPANTGCLILFLYTVCTPEIDTKPRNMLLFKNPQF